MKTSASPASRTRAQGVAGRERAQYDARTLRAGAESGIEPPSRPRRVRRLVAFALGTALATIVALFAWERLTRDDVAAFDRSPAQELLRQRSAAATRVEPPTRKPARAVRPEDRRFYLPIEDEQKLFKVSMRGHRYDPWTWYSHKPDLVHETAWAEHPRGRWTYRTNSIGLRSDREVVAGRPDLRVLVTGDSHTEGYCDNADSFPYRVEAALAARFPARTVEVLNAADGGYSFHNHLGVLEKFRDLRPHVFVVAVHGGNDFREILLPYRYFARLPPVLDPSLAERAGEAGAIFIGAVFQSLASVGWFQSHPADIELALGAAQDVMTEIQQICAEDGIRLLCLYLPSPVEMELERNADRLLTVMQSCQIGREDLDRHALIGQRFLRQMQELGVDVLDTTPSLRAVDGPCFWREDLHLNLAGHAAIATVLEPLVVQLVGW